MRELGFILTSCTSKWFATKSCLLHTFSKYVGTCTYTWRDLICSIYAMYRFASSSKTQISHVIFKSTMRDLSHPPTALNIIIKLLGSAIWLASAVPVGFYQLARPLYLKWPINQSAIGLRIGHTPKSMAHIQKMQKLVINANRAALIMAAGYTVWIGCVCMHLNEYHAS